MPQRNRDRIMQQSLYDLLMKMNEQLLENAAKIERRGISTEACIMDCFMDFSESKERCTKHRIDCDKCIQAWLNEYPI